MVVQIIIGVRVTRFVLFVTQHSSVEIRGAGDEVNISKNNESAFGFKFRVTAYKQYKVFFLNFDIQIRALKNEDSTKNIPVSKV